MNMKQTLRPGEPLIVPGHRACAGCGQMIAAMAAARGYGPDVIIANATGCLEVTTTAYPESAWRVPWIHSLFENPSSVGSGIRAALDYKIKNGLESKTKVIVQGGDGSTFDIGIGLISGMWERGDDILYICYDTEAYSNTGYQASGSTPLDANTTTSPTGPASLGNQQRKKDMIGIALAHGLRYVAQSTAGYPLDITAKVKKALETPGPSYIQILSPCIPGWGLKPSDAVLAGKLAVQTGLYPLLEYIDGKLINISKLEKPAEVEEYMKIQARFKHLFGSEEGKRQIEYIKQLAQRNIEHYQLCH